MKCKNCGAELMDGIMFCPECGEKNEISEPSEVNADQVAADQEPGPEKTINLGNAYQANYGQPQAEAVAEKKYCPQCGTENTADAVFCGNCGFSFTGTTSAAEPAKKKKNGVKKMLAVGAVVAGVVVLGVGAYTVLASMGGAGSKDASKKLLYAKDNELNILSGKKPITIEGDLCDNGYEDRSYYPVKFSEDGKYMFYPQEMNDYGYYDLYRRKANSKTDKGVKLASGVKSYQLIDNDKIAYLKDDGKLYITKKDDKQKVDSGVSSFKISEDKKTIFWIKSDGDMFVRDVNLKKEETKLDEDVYSTYYVSNDLKTIIYLSDEELFVIKNFGDEEKIASDVTDVMFSVDDSDKLTLYYTKEDDSDAGFRIGDAIVDDMAASDALIKEPKIEDYQKKEMRESFWGPVESTVTDYDSYNADYQKYQQKLARDDVRTRLDNTIDIECEEVYYYDVKENKSELVLSAPLNRYYSNSSAGFVVFAYYDTDAIEQTDLSKISEDEYYQLEYIARQCLADTAKVCAIKKLEKLDLNIDVTEYGDFSRLWACAETDMLYLVYNNHDNSDNTLLCTNFSKDKGSMTELSDELYDIEFVDEKGVYYLTSVEYGEGELFLNDDFLVDDVKYNTVRKFGKNDVIYASDENKGEYTLMLYKNGKQKQIADEVADYYVLDDDSIAFLADYNFNRYKGDLKLYDDGKVKDIDTDVAAIIRY